MTATTLHDAARAGARVPRVSAGGRISELDGYRGVAVLSIVIYHYVVLQLRVEPGSVAAYLQKYLESLWVGVDAFFVLSGFLIGGILLDQRQSGNLLRVFYVRRALRIFPPYLMLLICWLAVAPFSHLPGMAWLFDSSFPAWPYVLYVQNFWMAAQGGFGPNFVAATWSLAIEEQFYLLFPFALRWVSLRAVPELLGVGALLPAALRLGVASLGGEWRQALIVLLPMRWDPLLLGALAAWVIRQPEARAWVLARRRGAKNVLYLLSAWMILLPGIVKSPDWLASPWRASVVYLAIALYFSMIVLLLSLGELRMLATALSGRTLRFFGRISYFLYLFHTAVLGLAFALLANKPPLLSSLKDWGIMFLALASCLTLAALSWRWIEAPLVGRGHRFIYSKPLMPRGRSEEPSGD